jgi:mono/diheme cytochrome c family protein
MKTRILFFMALITSIFFIQSCYYDNGDALGGLVCDTNSVAYSNQVRAILDNNCMECHDAGGIATLKLENYDQVSTVALSGQLLGSIRHEDNYEPMPRNKPQLNPCNIRQIEIWVSDGAPNN